MENQYNHSEKKSGISRRDALKGLATVPVLGAFAYGLYKKTQYDSYVKGNIRNLTDLSYEAPKAPVWKVKADEKQLRIGIIGYGSRGSHLLRSTGYADPKKVLEWKEANEKNNKDRRYFDYMEQDDLNVVVNGVCDVFTYNAERAMLAGGNKERTHDEIKIKNKAKFYRTYQELLAADDIDAVIIATPDHQHAAMAIAAAKAGKHVYVEKGMTRTYEEAIELRKIIRETGITFQLGHQGRQTESYIKAKEAYQKDAIGKISLIEVCTNRNDPNGAWVYDIHPDGNPETIDWNQFLFNAPQQPFSLEKFFRWRCWWDFGSGLSGDLFTHEFDGINQILQLGIPESVVASGGVYFYKDGREVPDVYHTVCEYPSKDLTLLYSATLASETNRGKRIMGHDGTMEISDKLVINVDSKSTKYAEKIKNKTIDTKMPIYSYTPGMKQVDAIASATEQYFASRGLLYTYRDGKRYDTTYLHIKEWLDCIRNNAQPSCDIEQGFQEAIAAHMGTKSYMEGCKVYWDAEKEQMVTEKKVRIQ